MIPPGPFRKLEQHQPTDMHRLLARLPAQEHRVQRPDHGHGSSAPDRLQQPIVVVVPERVYTPTTPFTENWLPQQQLSYQLSDALNDFVHRSPIFVQ